MINDALKKIAGKASLEDLEKLKQEIRDEMHSELDKIRQLIQNFKATELQAIENKDNIKRIFEQLKMHQNEMNRLRQEI